jgi:hypothetical protein
MDSAFGCWRPSSQVSTAPIAPLVDTRRRRPSMNEAITSVPSGA